jgi:hypothetical protein
MADQKITITGLDKLRGALKKLEKSFPEEVGRALYREALEVERVSRSRTPVRFGVLKASHVTAEPKRDRGGLTVTISVGGPAAGYAIYVHENLEAHHHVGQAKFLESALKDASAGLADRVARRVDLGRVK